MCGEGTSWEAREAGSGARQYLDVLQQVLHVSHREAVEEGVRLVHLHSQVVVLGADVLGQQVNGLGPSVPDSNLGAMGSRGVASELRL